MERSLWVACGTNHVSRAHKLLQFPSLQVNWQNLEHHHRSALHLTCELGNKQLTLLLLRHPDIDPNLQDAQGHTPLMLSCALDQLRVAKVLVLDKRTRLDVADPFGVTALWLAALRGATEIVKWLIASGKDLGKDQEIVGLDVAREAENLETLELLKRFQSEPELTRHELRVELCLQGAVISELFALVIFLCDNLLLVKSARPTEEADPAAASARRFFALIVKLPMELQMVICHRVYESAGELILTKSSEVAFRSVVRKLQPKRAPVQTSSASLKPVSASFLMSALCLCLSVASLVWKKLSRT